MRVLVLGGTRFVGVHLVRDLLRKGHQVTIATRGLTKDEFGDQVTRILMDRWNSDSLAQCFSGKHYDVIVDHLAYCSNDVKYLWDSGIQCRRYIMISSTAVYDKHMDIKEDEYEPKEKELKWCTRMDFPYDEVKRQAEAALFQLYSNIPSVAVRYPFVIGEDDYTQRLYFYVEHILKGIPMYVDNMDSQLGFIRSSEAGKFVSFLVDNAFCGPINGCNDGTISIKQITEYIELKTGKSGIYKPDGDIAPYNGEPDYSINTDTAKKLGFHFTLLSDWIYDLLDHYIEKV